MRTLTFLLLAIGLPAMVAAQCCTPSRHRNNSDPARIHTEIGGSGQYVVARTTEAPQPFDADFLGGQIDGMIGLRFDARGRRRGNVLGVWGRYGLPSQEGLNRQLGLIGIDELAGEDPVENRFQEWEVGLMLRERIRFSAGRGEQFYMTEAGDAGSLNYYVGTVGLNLRLSPSISWNTTATLMTGGDYDVRTWRAATGLSLFFNWLEV